MSNVCAYLKVMVNHAPLKILKYKVLKYNFYIGSAKKKNIDLKKKNKRIIFPTNIASLFCHQFANQKSNPSSLYLKRDLFVVCGYNKSPVLKVNYQKT